MFHWPWRAVENERERKNVHWQKNSEGVGENEREEGALEVSMVTLALSLFVLDCKCNKVRKNAEVRAVIAWAFFHTESPGDNIGGPACPIRSLSLDPSALHVWHTHFSFKCPTMFVFTKVLFWIWNRKLGMPVSLFKYIMYCYRVCKDYAFL